jgi:hypothetical protein
MEEDKKTLIEAEEEITEATKEMEEATKVLKKTKKRNERAERIARAREIELEIASRTIALLTTALAVVAGFFWQTALADTIKTFIPEAGAWQYEIAVAFGFTVLAGVAIYVLSKSQDGMKK